MYDRTMPFTNVCLTAVWNMPGRYAHTSNPTLSLLGSRRSKGDPSCCLGQSKKRVQEKLRILQSDDAWVIIAPRPVIVLESTSDWCSVIEACEDPWLAHESAYVIWCWLWRVRPIALDYQCLQLW
jgi:hypothetical protein